MGMIKTIQARSTNSCASTEGFAVQCNSSLLHLCNMKRSSVTFIRRRYGDVQVFVSAFLDLILCHLAIKGHARPMQSFCGLTFVPIGLG